MNGMFHNWEIDTCIGSGAFGKVYRIVRTEFGHTYEAALKVIEIPQYTSEVETVRNEGMSEENITEYFESMVQDIVKEFALMSKLKGNSHIVSYEDHEVVKKKDVFGWEIYIRMELLTPLFSYTTQHQMTVSDVVKMGIHLCKALELCERNNIIHRDIKPENIFISHNGDFKLGDFGIAREMEKTSGDLSKKGTKSYMAPEVYKGMEYGASVDIYSLGIVLFRFLNNNRLPFYPDAPKPIRYSDKENATILRMSGQKIPKPCNASDELAGIISKACAYLPSERYSSAKEMREDLENVYQSECLNADKERNQELVFERKEEIEKPEIVSERKEEIEKQNIISERREEPERQPEFIFGKKEEIEQESAQETDIENTVAAETEYFDTDNATENVKEEEYTATVLMEAEKESTLFFDASQEQALLSKPKEEEKKSLKMQAEHLEQDAPGKKKGYMGVAIGVLFILILIAGIWARQEFKQTAEQKGTVLSAAISVPAVNVTSNLVPDTKGMDWEEAKKLLTHIGLVVKVEKEYDSSVKKGVVIRQSLDAGIPVEEGKKITLVISNGDKPKPTARPTPNPTEEPVFKPTPAKKNSTSTENSNKKTRTTAKPKSSSEEYNEHEINNNENTVEEWKPNE